MLKSVELRRDRAALWEKMKALHDVDDLSAEQEAEFDRMDDEVEKLDVAIAREERYEQRERDSAEPIDDVATDANPDAMAAFRQFLANGLQSMSPQMLAALQADTGDLGGFLVMPEEFVNELIQAVDDQVIVRQLATVRQLTSAASLGVPSIDTDPSDADWTAEVATGSEDTATRFGKRELTPHPLAKRIKVSKKLIRLTSGDAEDIVNERLAYKFAVTQEKAFMTGNGVNRPLGLFTASADGIDTSRDVVAGSATDFTADGVIDLKFALKGQYWSRPGTRWVLHRDGLKRIRKLKDTTNQYLWAPGLAGGEPSTILDIPYFMSEFAPNTFTTGLYVAILGDFSTYWIAEALNMEIQRLVELYAEANQVGFIGRAEVDGMPTLAEAFVRGKLA